MKELEREVIRCIKCGACQSVCPIYKELKTEASVARGKVNLIKAAIKGDVELTDTFSERMSWCLLCKACVEACPSGVKVDSLVIGARNELVKKKGLPFIKKIIFEIGLKNRRLFDVGLSMGSIFQGILFKKAEQGEGVVPRIPMGLAKRRVVKPLAKKTFRARYPEKVTILGARANVAFFTGCMINHVYPQVGEAVVKVLQKNNINIIIPANQHCCGTPVHVNGDVETAELLMKQTIDTFYKLEVDAIITACGSCGLSLKKEYLDLLKDSPEYLAKAKIVSEKAVDFSKYMIDIGLESDLVELNEIVTYHDSCHLARGQGVKSEPRQLIKSIPGVQLKEMKNPGECCGSAGSFSLSHYDLSMKINSKKAEAIANTGAKTIVTGCPACMMQINDGLVQNGHKITVMHTAELLAKAISSKSHQIIKEEVR